MCSYNMLNGTFACENDIIQTVLKDELDFQGYVMSGKLKSHDLAQHKLIAS